MTMIARWRWGKQRRSWVVGGQKVGLRGDVAVWIREVEGEKRLVVGKTGVDEGRRFGRMVNEEGLENILKVKLWF